MRRERKIRTVSEDEVHFECTFRMLCTVLMYGTMIPKPFRGADHAC